MKKVEFVRVRSKITGFKLLKGYKFKFEGHQEIIKEMLEKGYDYKGWIPVVETGTGDTEEIDLIFVREN